MALSNIERETVILYNQEEPMAGMETFHPKMIKRMDAACRDFPNEFSCTERKEIEGVPYGVYTFPKKYIKVSLPRVLTEEQKAIARERLRANRGEENDE